MEEAEKEAEATRQAIKRKIAQAAVTDFQMRSLPAKLRIEPNDPDDLVLITYIHTATSQVIKALCVFCKQIFQFLFFLVVPNLMFHCFSELVFFAYVRLSLKSKRNWEINISVIYPKERVLGCGSVKYSSHFDDSFVVFHAELAEKIIFLFIRII